MKQWGILTVITLASGTLLAQTQTTYTGFNITGELTLARTVNVLQLSRQAAGLSSVAPNLETDWIQTEESDSGNIAAGGRNVRFGRLLPPDLSGFGPSFGAPPRWDMASTAAATGQPVSHFAIRTVTGLPVIRNTTAFGFSALTHAEQRLSNNGNQFNVEPPNPSIAVANGFILEGVNNAIQVYTDAGVAVLPKVLSSNELFGVAPAIIRATGVNGVYPTDMRVFHDQTINRWFVLQRAQDYDLAGNTVASSHMYMAVSQTADPAGVYNIYVMDTTDASRIGCPCVADYPQIGADQHGFYISSGQYNVFGENFINAQIHAVSKASLAANAVNPTVYRFTLPLTTGYEFSIQPATTPAGGQFFSGSNGIEYMVSSQARSAEDNGLAVYAITNTASLATSNPSLTLTQIIVPVVSYTVPDVATQKPGTLTYGSTFIPPGSLAFIDGGDARIQALSYAGGRLYTSLATALLDENGQQVVGGAYMILSPTYRNGILAAPVLRQGYVAVRGNHLLRSGIAVNAAGKGAIAATLVGPDHFPSAVYLPMDVTSGPTSVQLTGVGAAPEDGFTGYPGGFGAGLARWGDYTTSFVTSDGAIWSTVQYIPNAPRTERANWGSYITKYVP